MVALALPAAASAATFGDWETVANNLTAAPGGSGQTFLSYNPPSVSGDGLVVFRGRARTPGMGGGGGAPLRGVYARDMGAPGQPVVAIADTLSTLVPEPNNLGAGFAEFPAFPRIDVGGAIAFRGQHMPVYRFTDATGADTRAGTSGVYATAPGPLTTAASQLGFIPEFSEFAVPGSTAAGTRFDQFPGAPSPDGDLVAFKGNWTDALGGRTGVYFRDLSGDGESPVQLVAESGMLIPDGGGAPGSGAVFGSTAPPSAAGDGWSSPASTTRRRRPPGESTSPT